MQVLVIVLSVLAGLASMALFFRWFFGDREEFFECIRFWLTPDIISLFRGEWGDDWWAEWKLGFWFLMGIVPGVLVYMGLARALLQSDGSL